MKRKISVNLSKEYSLEDIFNIESNKRKIKLSKHDVLNKLGIFKNILDIDTNPNTYAYESAINFSESEKFGTYATEELSNLNKNINFIGSVSRRYGLESDDMFKIGLEGVGDTLKRVGIAIITALKKLGSMIMNFIRSLGNTVKSMGVSSQYKIYEKFKDAKFEKGKGDKVNVMIPKTSINSFIKTITASVMAFKAELSKVKTDISEAFKENKSEDGAKKLDEAFKSKILSKLNFSTSFNNIGESTINPSTIIEEVVFGKGAKIEKLSHSGDFLNMQHCDIMILKKENFESVKNEISKIKELLKDINNEMKNVDKLLREQSKLIEKDDKDSKKIVKSIQNTFAISNKKRFYISKVSSLLVLSFSTYLKIRSYVAASIRAYIKTDEPIMGGRNSEKEERRAGKAMLLEDKRIEKEVNKEAKQEAKQAEKEAKQEAKQDDKKDKDEALRKAVEEASKASFNKKEYMDVESVSDAYIVSFSFNLDDSSKIKTTKYTGKLKRGTKNFILYCGVERSGTNKIFDSTEDKIVISGNTPSFSNLDIYPYITKIANEAKLGGYENIGKDTVRFVNAETTKSNMEKVIKAMTSIVGTTVFSLESLKEKFDFNKPYISDTDLTTKYLSTLFELKDENGKLIPRNSSENDKSNFHIAIECSKEIITVSTKNNARGVAVIRKICKAIGEKQSKNYPTRLMIKENITADLVLKILKTIDSLINTKVEITGDDAKLFEHN